MSPEKRTKLADLAREPWKCVSIKPPECYWPDCGCDPYATEVINHLDEAGWKSPPVSPAVGSMALDHPEATTIRRRR